MNKIKSIPFLGAGVSYRGSFSLALHQNKGGIDFLEIVADHYIDAPPEKIKELDFLLERYTLIPHAINLSLGSAAGLNKRYLRKLSNLIRKIDPPYWSEHISFNEIDGIEIGHLSPLPLTSEALFHLEKNIQLVTAEIACPLILENISYLVNIPGQEMSEGEFIRKLTDCCDVGLLLDVTNLFYNSMNHHFSVEEFMKNYPLEKVVQLHFTGGILDKGIYIDNHSSRTPSEVWTLMEKIIAVCKVKGIILERDDSQPDFQEMLQEVSRAKKLLAVK